MAIVVPSKDTSVTTYLVDDQFGNLITYSDGWQVLGVIEEFGGTTHGASTAGMTATFAFSGTKVHVFGTVGETQSDPNPTRGPPQSSYSIDGGPVTQYTAPSTNISLRSVHFFESPILSNGQHVLTITYNGGREYYLDYIQYIGPIQTSTTSNTASTPSFASTKSSTSTSTTTTGATTLPAASGNTSTNTPVLAGAVVGAFFGGVIVALLCVFCWSYTKRNNQPRQFSNAPLNLNDPDTFTTASFHPSQLYRDAAGSQPASVFTQAPPTGPTSSLTPSSNGGSSTRGLYTRSTTSDSHHIASGSNPPAYSKRREAFGS